MAKKQTLWAAALGLFVLTLSALLSVNQSLLLLFAVWMTAYPKVNTAEWQTRLYARLAITVGIGICWGALAIWMFRQRRISN
jgi:hypothetical protein